MKTLPLSHYMYLAALCAVPTVLRAQPVEPSPMASPPLAPISTDPLEGVQFRGSVGGEYDTNVLRLTGEGPKRSDRIGIASVGVKAFKRYGLQRFNFDADATRFRYRDLGYLDYSTLNYAAAWNWQITPALQGILSADRRQYRDITDTVGLDRISRRTERTEILEANYRLDGTWLALAGVTYDSTRGTDPRSADASNSVRSSRVGARYEAASGRSITGRLRYGKGEYTNGTNTVTGANFEENEAELLTQWPLTPRTAVSARVAYIERNHPDAPVRNFDGPIGNAAVSWDATAKIRLVAGVARDLGSYQAEGANGSAYVQITRVFIAPVYKPTANTALNLRYERDMRTWRGAGATAIPGGRNDVTQWASAVFDYELQRSVTLSGSVRGEFRKSNLALPNYRSTIIGGAVKVLF